MNHFRFLSSFAVAPPVVHRLSAGALVLWASLHALPSRAVELSLLADTVKGSFDTTVSYGVLMRADRRDPALVGAATDPANGRAAAANADDGNGTYDRGDVVSALFKMTNELELSYRNYGFFARSLLFYDTAIRSKATTDAATRPGLTPEAKNRLKDDARLLDFYVSGQFDVAQRQLNARVGRQVINWGESLFIPNGINIINPVDLTRLRAPGSEIKEALLPQEMVWVSQELTGTVSAEAFYQFKWRETRLDPRGSFFSTTDALSPGGRQLDSPATPYTRLDDRTPRDGGQYGVAVRALAPRLNNTEFAAYYIRYHSRTPFFSTRKSETPSATPPFSGFYFADFPDDITVLGLSLSTALRGGTSVQAEYSFRPSMPIQIATTELVVAATGSPANRAGFSGSEAPGSVLTGFRRLKMHQAQVAATHSFGPRLGASQVLLTGEAGLTRLGLPDDDSLRFDGPATFVPAATPDNPNANGYATRRSWGYRALVRAEYPNAVLSATLIPRLAFSHDVRGVGPTFNQGVQSVSVGVTAQLRQSWQADLAYTAFMGGRTYTNTTGTRASSAHFLKDRDFISATVSYAF